MFASGDTLTYPTAHIKGKGVRCMQYGLESKWEIIRHVDCYPCFLLVHGSIILILLIKSIFS